RAAQAEPGMRKLDIDRSTMRLNSDEAKNYADAAVIEKLRARVATLSGAAAPAVTPETPKPAETTTPPVATSGNLADAQTHAHTAHAMFDGGDPDIAQTW